MKACQIMTFLYKSYGTETETDSKSNINKGALITKPIQENILIMENIFFDKAMRAYWHYCNVTSKPFIPRSRQFSSADGEMVYLCFSQSDYPIKYSIISDAIIYAG